MATKVAGTFGAFAPILDGSATPESGDVAGVLGEFKPVVLETAAAITVTPSPVVVEVDVIAVSASVASGISIPVVQHHRQRNF